ncbi:hypothetical protein OG883_45755 [Streptomyces sp. NBC_01142]|uniref:hypothetical protein n=1 Tax=Streptomyces sp. NBC_01142 TaxID=2975865 RepID=UPI002256101B|nr:hypothetical protein [Streptomyces sp. NBC_01142]MCX4826946.1 hypothetical protein [Streptomyces sp. NBC_01142]
MTATRLDIPAPLRPRWRQLPRLAALAQRRLGPPPIHPCTRPAACWLWLLALAVMHAGGRVLAHGTATVSVTGPRMPWPRRAAYAGVLLLGIAVLVAWLWLPLQAAAWAVALGAWPLAAYGIAIAVMFSVPAETGNMLLRARTIVPVTTTVHYLRNSTGGTWWEAGSLVAREDDPVSAGRLVHHALHLADTHEAGLVVVPNSPAAHRAYLRRGFTPGPLNPRILIRPPHARTRGDRNSALPLA